MYYIPVCLLGSRDTVGNLGDTNGHHFDIVSSAGPAMNTACHQLLGHGTDNSM